MRAALLLAAGLLWGLPAQAAPVGQVLGWIPAPGPCTTGLAYDGAHLWAADHKTDTLYKLDPRDGKVLARLPSPGHRPAGLAWDGERLWVADPPRRKLYRVDPARGVHDRELEAPLAYPAALAFDGTQLWLAGLRQEALLRVDRQDGTTIVRREAPTADVSGMTRVGETLWVADRIRDRIHVLHPEAGEVLFTFAAPGPHVTGLAFDGRQVWAADYQTDRIYRLTAEGDRIPLRRAERTQRVEYTRQLRNLGPGTLAEADIFIAVPANEGTQRLAGPPRFAPPPAEVLADGWGQRVARFRFRDIGPGKEVQVVMTAEARLYDERYQLQPRLVQGLAAVPRPLRKLYLADGEKYLTRSPTIRKAVAAAVGAERNPYWIARKLYRYVHQTMAYKLSGGWNVAPRVLERGSGSCSEYAFAYIALLRAAGVPARYVGALVVRKDDASYDDVFHRWVEVYLPGYGWIPVDPSRGDKPGEAARADAFGHLKGSFLITTRGGGGSPYLGWSYNSEVRWSCKGRCEVQEENIAEWTPVAPAK